MGVSHPARARVAIASSLSSVAVACVVSIAGCRATTDSGAELRLKEAAGIETAPMAVEEHVGVRARVLIVIGLECPIANAFQPEIQAISRDYAARGVEVMLVDVDRDATAARVREHAREFGCDLAVLLDPRHELVDRLHATVTPEAFVLDARGAVAYSGRIDDTFVAIGKKRTNTTTHELREALDAVLAGREPSIPRTAAVGCLIE